MKMNKILAILLLTLIGGCTQDTLESIKKSKIKNRNITWGQATEQFGYCKEGTKKWRINEEKGSQFNDGRVVATFSCNLNLTEELSKKISEPQLLLDIYYWKGGQIPRGLSSFKEEAQYLVNDKLYGFNSRIYLGKSFIVENEDPLQGILKHSNAKYTTDGVFEKN